MIRPPRELALNNSTAFSRAAKALLNPPGAPQRKTQWHSSSEALALIRDACDKAVGVTAQEAVAQQYVAALENERLLDRGPHVALWGALDIWAKNAVLLKDRYAVDSGLAVDAVFRVADECRDTIPGREDWIMASCEKEFAVDGPGHRYAWHMHQTDNTAERFGVFSTRTLVAPTAEKRAERLASARAFINEDYEFSRLEILKEKGRGTAWLMHCLIEAPMEDIQMALEAGLDLRDASPQATRDFFEAMMRRHGEYEQILGEEKGGSLKNKAQKEQLERAKNQGFIERWDRWEIALKAGLPQIEFTPEQMAAPKYGHDPRPTDSALGLAILAQEALRDGKIDSVKRHAWLYSTAMGPWSPEIAKRLGAPEGQTALQWAFRHGLSNQGWSHSDLFEALWFDSRKNRTEVLVDCANAGVIIKENSDPVPRGLVPSMMENGAGLDAAKALAKMGADFFWTNGDQGLVHALIAVGKTNGGVYCRQALDAIEEIKPGSAAKLLAKLDENGAGAVHWSAHMLTVDGLQMCFDYGMDINAKDKKGLTAMHHAAKKFGEKVQAKFVPVVKWLAEHGFDWAATNPKGETALAALAKKGPVDALAEILKNGAELASAVEQKDAKGRSAMDHLRQREGAGEAIARAEGVAMAGEIQRMSMANRKKESQALAGESARDNAASADNEEPPKRSPRRM